MEVDVFGFWLVWVLFSLRRRNVSA